jgi:hypothetical protein
MSETTAAHDAPVALPVLPKISLRELAPWLFFGVLMMLMVLYFVTAEQGATSMVGGSTVHEFLHDARHLLGFPCH